MSTYVKYIDPNTVDEFPGAHSHALLTRDEAPTKGCCTMLNYFYSESFHTPGVHEDNEGFYVVDGVGEIDIGGKLFSVSKGTSIIVPAGVEHSIRKIGDKDLEVFIFHFPA